MGRTLPNRIEDEFLFDLFGLAVDIVDGIDVDADRGDAECDKTEQVTAAGFCTSADPVRS